jgi:hypothetical protein
MTRRAMQLLVFSVMIPILTGCAARVQATITAPDCRAPVSYSDAVPTASGEWLSVWEGDLEVVHHFEMNIHHFAIVLGFIPLTKPIVDLSTDFNRLLDKHQGDAIVHLTVESRLGSLTFYSGIFTLGLLLPAHSKTTIQGDIVRLRRAAAGVPPDPAHADAARLCEFEGCLTVQTNGVNGLSLPVDR